jgi:hypothetical protein
VTLTACRLRALAAALATAAAVVAPIAAAPAAATEPQVDVVDFGFADDLGAPAGALAAPIIGIEAHPRRHGYWLLGADGGVFTHGAARFFGSTGALALNQPVVGIEAHRSGEGYWLVAADGGVFTFGRARFFGSTGAMVLNEGIVDMASTPRGDGYWLVAQDGGVFTFGSARFRGSLGGIALGSNIVAIEATPSGRGYLLAAADGRVFAFGDAPAAGDAGGHVLGGPVVDIEITPSGRGYWLLAGDGAVYAFGDARYLGGANDVPRGAVGIAGTPEGAGYWIATVPSTPPLPPGSGSGRRIVYANAQQRVWLVEASGRASHSFLVSGRQGVPRPGTYHVFSKSLMSSAHGGDLLLPKMTRFAWGTTLAIGFHGIPLRASDGSPIQTEEELGQFRSAGCVRMAQSAIDVLWDWAPIGTTVVVVP